MHTPYPFDKLETESAKAFAAFCVYRDMGPNRTLVGAYRQATGKKDAKNASGQWLGWSDKHEWRRRAEAWDGDQDKQRRDEAAELHALELETYRQETILRVRKVARVANDLIDAALAKLADPKFVKDMSPRDAAIFIRVAGGEIERATRIEGIALGILSETGELLERFN